MNKRQSKELEDLATLFLVERGFDANGKKMLEKREMPTVLYEDNLPPWDIEEIHG